MADQPLTLNQFERFMTAFQTDLHRDFATKADLAALEARLSRKIEALVDSLDHYTKRTETWHEEQVAMRNRIERLESALRRKHVLTEDDLAA